MEWEPIETAPKDGSWFKAQRRDGTTLMVRRGDYFMAADTCLTKITLPRCAGWAPTQGDR